MKQMKHFSAFFSTILLFFFMGCASTPQQEGTGEYFDDSIITTKVKAAIFDEPSLKSSEINIETFKGVVQLSGFVDSREVVEKAVQITKSVQGVKAVKNNLIVK